MIPAPRASVIVLAWNGVAYLEPCLEAVLSQGYPDLEVLVVDNASTDGSADLVARRFPQVHLIRNELNLGFGAGNNVGLEAATGELLIVLNQDTVVQPGWLGALVEAFQDPAVGLVGCKILFPDGKTIQHAGGYLLWPIAEGKHYGIGERDKGQYDESREVEYVTGAALAMRRATYARIGGFDEQFFPGYYEDTDLCLRARHAGFKILYWPPALVHHHQGGSFEHRPYHQQYLIFRNQVRFIFKHCTVDEILDSFIPALMDRMELKIRYQLYAVALGSLDAMLIWPEVRPAGADEPTMLNVIRAFRDLHTRALDHERALVSI